MIGAREEERSESLGHILHRAASIMAALVVLFAAFKGCALCRSNVGHNVEQTRRKSDDGIRLLHFD
jgi:hypothetical protein